ncbi:isochorismatase family protein, partial [Acinetobacter baumannii]
QGEYQTGRLPLPGVEAAAAEIGRLQAAARNAGAPVIHVAHKGTAGGLFDREGPGGAFLEGIGPTPGEAVVEKRLPNSFAGTTLDEELA